MKKTLLVGRQLQLLLVVHLGGNGGGCGGSGGGDLRRCAETGRGVGLLPRPDIDVTGALLLERTADGSSIVGKALAQGGNAT